MTAMMWNYLDFPRYTWRVEENKRTVGSEKAVVVLDILMLLLEGQTDRKSGKGANTVQV